MGKTYYVVATGKTEADLIAENEHGSLREARADANRIIHGDSRPQRVEITSEEGANVHFTWEAGKSPGAKARGPAKKAALAEGDPRAPTFEHAMDTSTPRVDSNGQDAGVDELEVRSLMAVRSVEGWELVAVTEHEATVRLFWKRVGR
jgi:hypothetical protein